MVFQLPNPTQEPYEAPYVCVALNRQWLKFLIGIVSGLKFGSVWEGDTVDEDKTQRARIATLETMLANAYEGECADVDRIGEYVLSPCLLPFPRYIPCDGRELLRVDYPILYDRIDAAYIIDADTFNLPNMPNKTFIGAGQFTDYQGEDNERSVGESVGSAGTTLNINQLPEHTHTIAPHFHTYQGVQFNGVDLQEFTDGTPRPHAAHQTQNSGAVSQEIDSSGLSEPFDNTPPAEVAYIYIVAK